MGKQYGYKQKPGSSRRELRNVQVCSAINFWRTKRMQKESTNRYRPKQYRTMADRSGCRMVRGVEEDRIARIILYFESETDDPEARHITADDILCDLLRDLGYGDVAEAFKKIEKWYA